MLTDHLTDLTRSWPPPSHGARAGHDGPMVQIADITRLRLGSFIRPARETGTGTPRVEVVLGYLIRHERGTLLLDTGIGDAGAETEEWYRPARVALPEALDRAGARLDDVTLATNCHLHFDHCGGNPLAGRYADRGPATGTDRRPGELHRPRTRRL